MYLFIYIKYLFIYINLYILRVHTPLLRYSYMHTPNNQKYTYMRIYSLQKDVWSKVGCTHVCMYVCTLNYE